MKTFINVMMIMGIIFLSLCVEKALLNKIELAGYVTGVMSGVLIICGIILIEDSDL